VRSALPYDVAFALSPITPSASTCHSTFLAQPTPTRAPAAQAGDPCANLSPEAVQRIMGEKAFRADRPLALQAIGGGLPGGTGCAFAVHHDNPVFDAVTVAVYIRTDVADTEVREIADSMLGDGSPEPLAGGWSLYSNGCTGPARVCPPSVMLARAPILYLIDTPTRFRDADARQIAAAIAASVDGK